MRQQVYNEFSSLEDKHWWFTSRRRYIDKVISRFFTRDPQRLSFCEIGCGTGGNLAMLANYAEVEAVEMNDLARQIVNNKNISGLRKVAAGHLPDNIPLDSKFDGVFALDVIEHVENDLAGLKALKTLLSDDGLLITTVPAYQWLWSAHDVANHHFRRYTKTRYSTLIQNAGYEICYASYFNTLLFPLAALSRLMMSIRAERDTDATINMPPRFINRLLAWIFGFERLWAGKVFMSFGLSIIVVAKVRDRH